MFSPPSAPMRCCICWTSVLDLLADLRLRQPDEDHVFLELVGRRLRLVAIDVERRGDDLPLLLRERARLVALLPAATAAAAAALL